MIYNLIILSFVVQNFLNVNFLVKTYRYKSLIGLQLPHLLYTLSKLNLIQNRKLVNVGSISPFVLNLYRIYFVTSFWKVFKKSFTRKLGTTTSNITKSAYFGFYRQLNNMYSHGYSRGVAKAPNKHFIIYTQANTLIPFNFTATTYNTLTFYLINILNTFYMSSQVEFKPHYAFFWKSPNLLTYDFLNRFYFRLKNY